MVKDKGLGILTVNDVWWIWGGHREVGGKGQGPNTYTINLGASCCFFFTVQVECSQSCDHLRFCRVMECSMLKSRTLFECGPSPMSTSCPPDILHMIIVSSSFPFLPLSHFSMPMYWTECKLRSKKKKNKRNGMRLRYITVCYTLHGCIEHSLGRDCSTLLVIIHWLHDDTFLYFCRQCCSS